MNSDIYCRQILEKLDFLSYSQYILEKDLIIQINNGASYYTLKKTVK